MNVYYCICTRPDYMPAVNATKQVKLTKIQIELDKRIYCIVHTYRYEFLKALRQVDHRKFAQMINM